MATATWALPPSPSLTVTVMVRGPARAYACGSAHDATADPSPQSTVQVSTSEGPGSLTSTSGEIASPITNCWLATGATTVRVGLTLAIVTAALSATVDPSARLTVSVTIVVVSSGHVMLVATASGAAIVQAGLATVHWTGA